MNRREFLKDLGKTGAALALFPSLILPESAAADSLDKAKMAAIEKVLGLFMRENRGEPRTEDPLAVVATEQGIANAASLTLDDFRNFKKDLSLSGLIDAQGGILNNSELMSLNQWLAALEQEILAKKKDLKHDVEQELLEHVTGTKNAAEKAIIFTEGTSEDKIIDRLKGDVDSVSPKDFQAIVHENPDSKVSIYHTHNLEHSPANPVDLKWLFKNVGIDDIGRVEVASIDASSEKWTMKVDIDEQRQKVEDLYKEYEWLQKEFIGNFTGLRMFTADLMLEKYRAGGYKGPEYANKERYQSYEDFEKFVQEYTSFRNKNFFITNTLFSDNIDSILDWAENRSENPIIQDHESVQLLKDAKEKISTIIEIINTYFNFYYEIQVIDEPLQKYTRIQRFLNDMKKHGIVYNYEKLEKDK